MPPQKSKLDLLIICPGDHTMIYQELAKEYSAIEPPIWGALIAQHARNKGYGVLLIDQTAEGLNSDQIVKRSIAEKPKLIAMVVYGQQPSASTQNMTAAIQIVKNFKDIEPQIKILMIGGHVSALPTQTLNESQADFVCQGEGPYTIDALLKLPDLNDESQYKHVPGLWYKYENKAVLAKSPHIIPKEELSHTLPGMAWDLLPMEKYRAHNWHCFDDLEQREPYASLYTSLGCPYKCSFCCINAPFGGSNFKYWDPDFTIRELEILANIYHVKSVKIADEMFVLNPNHFLKLCDRIIERDYDFNFWAYARIDTVKDHYLEKLKKAGFNWLCLGIESGSKYVRDGVQKGRFGQENIFEIIQKIQDAGIYVMGNFIFGLPDDTLETMQQTLDMAIELNCEMANFYTAMAYPGSQLYEMAHQKGWKLPKEWHHFSQHAYETLPLPTEHLRAAEVLSFRDKAWHTYFTHPRYLKMLDTQFGPPVVEHIQKLSSIKLKRKHIV